MLSELDSTPDPQLPNPKVRLRMQAATAPGPTTGAVGMGLEGSALVRIWLPRQGRLLPASMTKASRRRRDRKPRRRP